MNKKKDLPMPQKLLKSWEDRGIWFEVQGDKLVAKGHFELLTADERDLIKAQKELLIEALQGRELLKEVCNWNAEHAPDHVQLNGLVREITAAFQNGDLDMKQTLGVAEKIKTRARRVPADTKTQVVLFESEEEMNKKFPKREGWRK